jgi:hypothetical protein
MAPTQVLLIVSQVIIVAVASDPATDLEYVDVLDYIDLIVEDAFNSSYLSSTPFRGTETNTSFIPGIKLSNSTTTFAFVCEHYFC